MVPLNTKNKLSSSAFAYRLTTTIIGAIVLFVIGGVLISLGQLTSKDAVTGAVTSSFPGFLIGIPAILIGILGIIRSVLWCMTFSYIIQDGSITINSGILFRQSKTIDFNKIQNIDNVRGPLQMLFGITSVNIWTASQDQITYTQKGARARPEAILYLSREDADELKNYISGQGSVQNVRNVA